MFRLLWALAVALVAFPACAGPDGPGADDVDGRLHIVVSDSITVRPRESRHVAFQLVDEQGNAVDNRVMQFSIVDDPMTPEDEARGATLSFDRSITDSSGRVFLQIIAGLPTVFHLRAASARANDTHVVVFVTSATHGSAELVPVVEEILLSDQEITSVSIHFYDAPHDNRSCASLRPDALPVSRTRPSRSVPTGSTVVFSNISSEGSHAIVGLGLDGNGILRAAGCVDLPGPSLPLEDTARVVLPIHVLRVLPDTRYSVTSILNLQPPPKGVMGAAALWSELSQCPGDPARLWLDCTLDALGPVSAADPLDCRPAAEGPLADRIIARRGVLLPIGERCRDKVDGAGRPSLDALVEGLLPNLRSAPFSSLPSLPAELRQMFTSLKIHSLLAVAPTTVTERFLIEHTLRAVEFTMAPTQMSLELFEFALPFAQSRFVPAMLAPAGLEIATHGFTLRLGTLGRLAFGRVSLIPRGFPADAAGFVNALVGAATRTEQNTTFLGCGALDALVCPDVGEARGCLQAACMEGLVALGARLDAGFSALDGDDLDLSLGGSASLVDRDGDRKADALGAIEPRSSAGLWLGELRTRAGVSTFTGSWTAERTQ